MTEVCEGCKFWLKPTNECRRHPPVPFLIPGPNGQPALNMQYPRTPPNGWCGEYRFGLMTGGLNNVALPS